MLFSFLWKHKKNYDLRKRTKSTGTVRRTQLLNRPNCMFPSISSDAPSSARLTVKENSGDDYKFVWLC